MQRTPEPVWLPRTRRAPSPNADARPEPEGVELIVLHNISLPPGRFGTGAVEQFFLNTLDTSSDPRFAELDGVRVSGHLFIDRRGAAVQFVPFDRRAWHAGVSSYRGRSNCNDFAIGIELEGTDQRAYTARQYARLIGAVRFLFNRYPQLSIEAIVGHNEIAPGRKTDPGRAFDWQRLYRGMAGR